MVHPHGDKCVQDIFNYFLISLVYSRLLGRLSFRKGGTVLNLKIKKFSGVLAFAVDFHEIPKPSLNLPLSASFSSLVK